MSLNVDLYRSRLGAYKIGGKEGQIDSIKNSILKDFYTNPSYFEVLINEEVRDVHIVSSTSGQNKLPQNKVLCKPDEYINVGEYVNWKSKNYLCMSVLDDDTVQCKGLIQLCNNTLTYQHPTTKQIHTFPCVLTDKTSVYSDGIDEGKLISLADDQILIVVPNNNITVNILEDERFIFNHSQRSIYKASKVNSLLYNGLVHIVMTRDTYDENVDNLELNIADYVDTTEQPIPEIPPIVPDERNYEIILYGQDTIMLMQSANYNVRTFDNGIETGHDVRFELSNNLANIKSQDGRNCVIETNKNWNVGEVSLKVILLVDESIFIEKTLGIQGF